MAKISMLLPVYNEGILLKYSLEHTLKYVDEAIIMDGGPDGASTDGTKSIIDAYSMLYPNKIKYYTGIFRMANGAWDESSARNYMLSKVTGDFIMPHCGDMIYTEKDIATAVEIINKYPDRKIIYCLFVEFWLDQSNIRMYGGNAMEAWYPVCAIGDVPFVASDLLCHYSNGPNMNLGEYTYRDFLFMPNVFRYHYGWISGFDAQVKKHIRNITMGAWAKEGDKIMQDGDRGVVRFAIKHVIEYPDYPCSFPYPCDKPIDIDIAYNTGMNEVIAKYKQQYGEDLLDD